MSTCWIEIPEWVKMDSFVINHSVHMYPYYVYVRLQRKYVMLSANNKFHFPVHFLCSCRLQGLSCQILSDAEQTVSGIARSG